MSSRFAFNSSRGFVNLQNIIIRNPTKHAFQISTQFTRSINSSSNLRHAAPKIIEYNEEITNKKDTKDSKKELWFFEDDDVSGYAEEAIKNYRENRVAGDVPMNTYSLGEGKEEITPVGFRQDLYK